MIMDHPEKFSNKISRITPGDGPSACRLITSLNSAGLGIQLHSTFSSPLNSWSCFLKMPSHLFKALTVPQPETIPVLL